jgi:hypothetical protein
MFVPVIARGEEPPITAPLIVPALIAAEAMVADVLTVRLVNVPAAAVVPPITAPFIVPPVMVAEELSVFVATAVAMLLNSVSISVPLTIFNGLPGDKLSLVAKLVDFE